MINKCFGTLENPCRGFRIQNVINIQDSVPQDPNNLKTVKKTEERDKGI